MSETFLIVILGIRIHVMPRMM